ncbi:MAG TPA: hypothetical protein VNA69_10970 [Thermoanaerobaculia bacterium]|nr:hypothetical protein [Thermoanaerobaculia bacterium]
MEKHPLDGLYAGQPIFILSTGTSLRGFDFSRLDGRITIGINRIIEYYRPPVLHMVDMTAQYTHAAALDRYEGIIIATENAAPRGRRNTFAIRHNVDTFELSETTTELSTFVGRSFRDGFYGGGAGCTAVHTAILLGGDPIYLLGYDFYEDNGRHFDVWDASQNAPELYGIPFHGLNHIARQPWIPRIYNCNPRSRLTCFSFASLETFQPLSPAA